MTELCKHCRHYKQTYLQGKLVSDYCKKDGTTHFLKVTRCKWFSQSLKSRLNLIGEFKK
jgi:hypothetical protein